MRPRLFPALIGCSQVTDSIYRFQFGVLYMYKEGSTFELIISRVLGDGFEDSALENVKVLQL